MRSRSIQREGKLARENALDWISWISCIISCCDGSIDGWRRRSLGSSLSFVHQWALHPCRFDHLRRRFDPIQWFHGEPCWHFSKFAATGGRWNERNEKSIFLADVLTDSTWLLKSIFNHLCSTQQKSLAFHLLISFLLQFEMLEWKYLLFFCLVEIFHGQMELINNKAAPTIGECEREKEMEKSCGVEQTAKYREKKSYKIERARAWEQHEEISSNLLADSIWECARGKKMLSDRLLLSDFYRNQLNL